MTTTQAARIENFNQLVTKARAENACRDAIDRASGHGTPQDCPPVQQAQTVKSALQAAIITEDWNAVAEAFVMLDDLEKALRVKQRTP